jgi:type VI secretion system secreted protein VgrG
MLADYDFEKPGFDLSASATVSQDMRGQVFDYPGRFLTMAEAERYSRIRLQERQSSHEEFFGDSNCRPFLPGHRFELAGHYRSEVNQEYLLLDVHHSAGDESYRSGDADAFHYSNAFRVVSTQTPYRPPQMTPKPRVRGSQTAVVCGKRGEEIFPDKYGRIKVQFHWDRRGKQDERSSCWVRVATPWAGKDWGSICIPRIGQEVVVDFLEGDPDRPIVTGSVYNATHMPPYPLPEGMTNMGMKSRSHRGSGYNEISINDEGGTEGITIHAQYNMQTRVENDETISIGKNRTEDVGVDEKIDIGSNRTETVGADERITIGANRTEKVGSNEEVSVGANRKKDVGANETVSIGGNRNSTIGKNEVHSVALTRTQSVGINEMINVGAAQQVTVGGIRLLTVGGAQVVTVGLNHRVQAGNKIQENAPEVVIEAGTQLILKGPGGQITIDGGGITIKGSQVKIN